ncbi:MAG: HD-GYP domain-containing protein [Candidatus Atribacteria bacterium]|nr:MAG: HD-GYP domain-containing protein [Candidatus Atribacteria bacterium]
MRIPARAIVYVATLAAAALCSVVCSALHASFLGIDQISIFCVFVILAVLAEVYATWIPTYNWEISSSIAIYLATVFILGVNLAVLLVFLSSLLSEMFLRWRSEDESAASGLLAITFNVSQLVVTVTLAGLLLQALQRQSLDVAAISDFGLAIAAFGVYFVANLSFVIGIVTLTESKTFIASLADSIRQFFVQYLVLCVSALLLAALYSISVWHVLLALFPLTLVHVSFRGYVKLQTEARNTFERISQLLDARDHYTAVHSMEVAELAVKIGREMGLGQREIEQIDVAARVHDIGKVAVPDSILLKPGKLSEEEWVKMREHPVISAELIAGIEIYSPVAKAVRHEHERWNGTGYPDGLKGEEIPLLARIIAAADIYNALSTDRPYRKAFNEEETIRLIQEMAEAELDPAVAAALLRVIEAMPAEQVTDMTESPIRTEA